MANADKTPLTFSRPRLAAWLACRRRFQLRYQQKLPWPRPPLTTAVAQAQRRGQAFHQLLQRHFLGLHNDEAEVPVILKGWWATFQNEPPRIPAGKQLVELSLTAPIGNHFLTGRFDLLVIEAEKITVFDWKTEARPRSTVELQADLQTQIYLALLVEGGAAVRPERPPVAAEISLTYWYVTAPDKSVTIQYNETMHKQNWAELEGMVADYEEMDADADWSLTETLATCTHCPFQPHCGRQVTAEKMSPIIAEEAAVYELASDPDVSTDHAALTDTAAELEDIRDTDTPSLLPVWPS